MHFCTRFSVNLHRLALLEFFEDSFYTKVGVVVFYTLTGLFQFIFLGGLLRAHRCIALLGSVTLHRGRATRGPEWLFAASTGAGALRAGPVQNRLALRVALLASGEA